MKYLNTLLKDNDLKEEKKEDVVGYYKRVKEKLPSIISLSDDAEFMLSNHILALSKRIKERVFVEEVEKEMMNEVSEEAFLKAEELVGWMFEEEGIPENRSEIFLVATHMEMALLSMKEEK